MAIDLSFFVGGVYMLAVSAENKVGMLWGKIKMF